MENKRLAQIVLVAFLALGCVLILRPFVAAILFAAIICVTTWPVYSRLLHKVGGRPATASLLMILILTLLVLLPMGFLAANVTQAAPVLADKISGLVHTVPASPPDWLKNLPLVGTQIQQYWEHFAAASSEETNKLLQQAYEPARKLLGQTVIVMGDGLLQLLLVLFIAFFFYRDGKAMAQRLLTFSRGVAGELGEQMLTLTRNTIMGVMVGIVGTALAQGLLACIGFLIAGVPAAVMLGAATFFLSMVPIGPPLIWGGAAFWLYDQGSTGWAIFMVLWGMFGISSVDNFLKPMLISRTSSLPILLITLGVFGGLLAFGFIGIFLGPTLLALGLVLAEKYTAARA